MQLIYIVLLILTCLLRLLIIKKSATFDTYGHLYLAKQISLHKSGPFNNIRTGMVGSGIFHSPVIYHWLIVKIFGFKNFLSWHWRLNPIMDLCFMAGLGLVFYAFAGIEIAIKASLLYLLIPLCLTLTSSGPRLRSWSPRLFTEISLGLYFILPYLNKYLIISGVDWLCLGLMTLLAVLVLGSSKFGLQAIVFIGIPASFISLDTVFFIPALLAFIILIGLSKGEFLKTVFRQFNHLKLYYRRNKSGKAAVRDRSNIFKSFKFPEGTSLFKRVTLFVFNRPSENGILAMILRFPSFLVSICLMFAFGVNGAGSDMLFLNAPLLAAFLAFVVTSIPDFLFLGEAERYPVHVAIVASLALVIEIEALTYGNWIYHFLVGYGFIYMLWDYKDRLLNRNNFETQFPESTIDFLNQQRDIRVILCYPYHLGSLLRIMVFTNHKAISTIFCDTQTEENIKAHFEEAYGRLRLDRLEDMYHEYGVDTVILREEHYHLLGKNWKLKHEEEGKAVFLRVT